MELKMTLTTNTISAYGWRPDLPDIRDYLYSKYLGWCGRHRLIKADIDLRPNCPPVYDQGALGSCTANATGAMFQFVDHKMSGNSFIPSRLFTYYNSRAMIGSISYDSGAYIRDSIKSVNRQGVCPETMWPYVIKDFTKEPTQQCYATALNHQAVTYMRVARSISEMQICLMEGYPFVFGFTVYESFQSNVVAETGIVPMPQKGEKVLGGHAVMAVGYNKKKKMMLVRNSWGKNWGLEGYFWMPFDFFTNDNLSDDFWTIRKVEV